MWTMAGEVRKFRSGGVGSHRRTVPGKRRYRRHYLTVEQREENRLTMEQFKITLDKREAQLKAQKAQREAAEAASNSGIFGKALKAIGRFMRRSS